MADLAVTAANVKIVSGLTATAAIAGAAVTAGQPVYPDGGKYYPARANAAGTADASAIALNSAGADQPLSITSGEFGTAGGVIDIGAVVAVGTIYVVSAAAAGGIAPATDLAATNRVTVIGVGVTASNIRLGWNASGVAVPA